MAPHSEGLRFAFRALTPSSAIRRRSAADSVEKPLGTLARPPMRPRETAAGSLRFIGSPA